MARVTLQAAAMSATAQPCDLGKCCRASLMKRSHGEELKGLAPGPEVMSTVSEPGRLRRWSQVIDGFGRRGSSTDPASAG